MPKTQKTKKAKKKLIPQFSNSASQDLLELAPLGFLLAQEAEQTFSVPGSQLHLAKSLFPGRCPQPGIAKSLFRTPSRPHLAALSPPGRGLP